MKNWFQNNFIALTYCWTLIIFRKTYHGLCPKYFLQLLKAKEVYKYKLKTHKILFCVICTYIQ